MSIFDLLHRLVHRPNGHPKNHRRRSGHCGHTRPLSMDILEERSLLSYDILDLGTLGGPFSAANAINAAGDVAGEAATTAGSSESRPFLYGDGVMIDLGTLGGFQSRAHGVNASRQVVGESNQRAFFYSDGVLTDLGSFGGSTASARGINDTGHVAGYASTPGANFAFLYDGGTLRNLGTLPGGNGSFGFAINASDQVVGWSAVPGIFPHAFLYSSGQMRDLGTLPGGTFGSQALAINDSGHVVGDSSVPGGAAHAFLYNGRAMIDLGVPPGGTNSTAKGINSSDQVVGTYNSGGPPLPFFYDGATMMDVNDLLPTGSGWSLFDATAINDAGQIVGAGRNPDGMTHAYLLSPGCSPTPGGRKSSSSEAVGLVQVASLSPSAALSDSSDGAIIQEGRPIVQSVPAQEVQRGTTAPTPTTASSLSARRNSPERDAQDQLFAFHSPEVDSQV